MINQNVSPDLSMNVMAFNWLNFDTFQVNELIMWTEQGDDCTFASNSIKLQTLMNYKQ